MATTRFIDGTGLVSRFAKKTTSSQTLYVRSTGNNSNAGTLASPLLTIAEAFARLPEMASSPLTVDVGSGTFDGATLEGRLFEGGLTIQGVMKTATVATGTASGTSTGGTNTTLIDSGQNWTTDDLKGKWVNVTGVGTLVIESNNTTTITIVGVGVGTSLSGKAYVIQDNDTTVSTTTAGFTFNDISCSTGAGLIVTQLKFTGANRPLNMTSIDTTAFCSRCLFSTSYGSLGSNMFSWSLSSCVANSIPNGDVFYASLSKSFLASNTLVYSNGSSTLGAGIRLATVRSFSISATVQSQGTGGNGVLISESCGIFPYLTVSNNGGSGVWLDNLSRVRYRYPSTSNCVIHGSGNTRFGVQVGRDCHLSIQGTTDVTGTLGNYSFNDSYARTWATDFASNGDIVVAEDTFSRVERVD